MPGTKSDEDSNLEDEDLDDLGDEDEEDEESEDEDSKDDEGSETELLRAKIEKLETNHANELNSFRSAMGRFQSSVDKLEQGRGDPRALERDVSESLQGVYGLLNSIAEDMGDTLSPDIQKRIRETLNVTTAALERDKLKEELLAEITPKLETPNADSQTNGRDQLAAMLEGEIRSWGLDPSDERIDWNKAKTLGSFKEIAESIRSDYQAAIREDEAAERRETRRKKSGAGTPSGSGAVKDDDQVMAEGSLEERMAVMRKRGITI